MLDLQKWINRYETQLSDTNAEIDVIRSKIDEYYAHEDWDGLRIKSARMINALDDRRDAERNLAEARAEAEKEISFG